MPAKASALLDTRVIYCGDNLDQLPKVPDRCVDLIYIFRHTFSRAVSAGRQSANAPSNKANNNTAVSA
jgi:hypothetical protein